VTRKIKYREKRNENLVKYRRRKRRDNIFTSVIDIPFPGKIFCACFWRSYILIAYTWKEVRRWKAQKTTTRNWKLSEPTNPMIRKRDCKKWSWKVGRRASK
jgi:hypothetical protein